VAESFFDIVSRVDKQEVDNALNQAAKEISNRFDFRGVGAAISWSGESVEIRANSEERAKAVLDVFKDKLVRRVCRSRPSTQATRSHPARSSASASASSKASRRTTRGRSPS